MDLLGQAKNGPRTKLFGTGQKRPWTKLFWPVPKSFTKIA